MLTMETATQRKVIKSEAVAALGLLTDDSTQLEVDFLFAKIIHDPVVDQRALAYGRVVDEQTGLATAVLAVTFASYVEILKAMTPTEKLQLRERLAGR